MHICAHQAKTLRVRFYFFPVKNDSKAPSGRVPPWKCRFLPVKVPIKKTYVPVRVKADVTPP